MAMLSKISGPADLKALDESQLVELARELREVIIGQVSRTGGHLASNLGAVELTIALHRALDCPRDKLVFDVGHQAYVHKLLTGRYARFGTLRQQGGISGFPRRGESEYDAFSVGHASTAISAALGMARARDALGEDYQVVAVVGDGALTGGMCYEALNDLGASPTHMTIVLNDNEMSIARNVGALSRYLTRLRNSPAYRATKARVRMRLGRLPVLGPRLIRVIERVKDALKLMLVRGSFFEIFGLEYVGPVDGHDLRALGEALAYASHAVRPVLLHVITQKGHGYAPAEHSPERFHGTAPFFIETGEAQSAPVTLNSDEMARGLTELMRSDRRVVGITAAMPAGTGMNLVAKQCPGRVFDVGIAEEHAVTLAAGMAAAGARPYVCLYSTFMQRAFDQLLHDVALDALPVCLLLDRAGVSGADGATHQGVFDLAFLSIAPGLRVMSPRCGEELRLMLKFALELNAPCAIRYARDADADLCGGVAPIEDGRWERVALAGTGGDSAHAGPAVASNAPEHSAPMAACNVPEHSTPTAASNSLEHSTPATAGNALEHSAQAAASNVPEHSAPATAGNALEHSSPTVASNAPEHSEPTATSNVPEHSTPTAASSAHSHDRLTVESDGSAQGGLADGSHAGSAPCVTFIAVGCMVNAALRAGELLRRDGVCAQVINARFVRPLDAVMLNEVRGAVVTVEDGIVSGGFGESVKLALARRDERGGPGARVLCLGYPDEFIEHASRGALLRQYGLDAPGIARSALEWVRRD